jgi:hypothetical protein
MIPKMTFHGIKVKLLVKGELIVENNEGEDLTNSST